MAPRHIKTPASSAKNILLIAFLVILGFLLMLACMQITYCKTPSETSPSGRINDPRDDADSTFSPSSDYEVSNSRNSIVISATNRPDKKPLQPPMGALVPSREEHQTLARTRNKEVASHLTRVNMVAATESRGPTETSKNAGGFQENLDSANANEDGQVPEAASVLNNFSGFGDIGSPSNGFADKINISNQRNEFNGHHWNNSDAEPSGTPRGIQESAASSSPMPQRVEKLLLLHRQKRYLLFPEGSSFQLVYDLIVPVVDYTNFAILGITCAIAWELPSKAPSEIIDNIREKLNDGTYGLSRRRNDNGTVGPLTMPGVDNTQAPTKDIEFLDRKSAETWLQPSVKPFAHIQPSASWSETTPPPPPPPPHYMSTMHRANFYTTGPTYRGADEPARPVYYGRNPAATGVPTNAYGYANADKQKFADWPHKEHNGIGVDTGDNRRNKWLHTDDRRWPGADAVAHGSANWWERNKQRVQSNWRDKQRQWSQRYASGRQLLQKPLKHRIYPVFAGKRRRRRQSSAAAPGVDGWLRELEEIHLREHLRSRQMLFGKIEKLFTAHGYNGTACVLQALCETGQRHHQYQQQQQQKRQRRHYHQEPEPQSFITELLRAIFVLPKDPPTTAMSTDKLTRAPNAAEEDGGAEKTAEALPSHHRRQAEQQQQRLCPRHLHEQQHIDVRYRRAYNEPHDNCAEIYHTCEHGDTIWSDF